MREEATGASLHAKVVGITPACAGRRTSLGASGLILRDHPRMCGKKIGVLIHHDWRAGSPPHVREEVYEATASQMFGRITPACAGRRLVGSFITFQLEDHPRVCGKKLTHIHSSHQELGSPPHMREEAGPAPVDIEAVGITPAYAGKRWCRPV